MSGLSRWLRTRVADFSNANLHLMLGMDALAFAVSIIFSYLLRFDFAIPGEFLSQMMTVLLLSVPLKSLSFLVFGLYRGMWRYTSLSDFWKIIRVSALQSVLLVSAVAYLFHFTGFPRSVFLMDWVMTLVICSGLRLGIRAWYARGMDWTLREGPRKRVLLVGAERAGVALLRELIDNAKGQYIPVAFVDDDSAMFGREIHGVSVRGTVADIPELVEKLSVDEIFITVSNASAEAMRRIIEQCKKSGARHRIIPGMSEIMDGKVSVNSLRDIDYLDLLGRSQVRLDTARIEEYISGRTVLVTGCGGSIGSELCRQLVRFRPGLLVLVDASEANLYGIEMELAHEMHFTDYVTVLGSIADSSLMERVFSEHTPAVVFHAAAYKHVPMLERNPWQAVENNVVGSRVVMKTAVRHGVERFVVVSTDKAVRPTNVMGASKRVTELLMRHYMGRGTRFMAVRFGNVLGSSGSVVPLFRRQIERGGPVTVTHPEVTRFFMSISEAAQLILQAGGMTASIAEKAGACGEIYVLEMGQSVRIVEMARDLIRLSGKEPDSEIEIEFTGLREGEKLYEELLTDGEHILPTAHEKILVLGPEEGSEGVCSDLSELVCELESAARKHDGDGVRELLARLVPEYSPTGH